MSKANLQPTKTKKTRPKYIKDVIFNLNSNDQKKELFYDTMQMPVLLWTDSETNPTPSMDSEALSQMGEVGKALIEYNEKQKLLSMVSSLVRAVGPDRRLSEGSDLGAAHVGLRVPGAFTGRCGGTDGLNLQNLPIDKGYLTAMVPEVGHKLITFDICFTAETEVFTDRGFLRFNEVTRYDKVLAVNPDTLEGQWENPKRIIWKKYNGKVHTFSNRKGSLTVTQDHTMLWAGQQSIPRFAGLRRTQAAQDGIPKTKKSMFTTCNDGSTSKHTIKDVWMSTLVQADSYQVSPGRFSVKVSRPTKVKKVQELLNQQGTIKPQEKHQTMQPVLFDDFLYSSSLLKGKSLFLEELGTNRAKVLFDALLFWDGSKKRESCYWRSTDKESFDQICRYFSRAGYTTRMYPTETLPSGKAYYHVCIAPVTSTRIKRHTVTDYTGYVGCVTVSTGFILVRSGGLTFVSGNCALEPTVLAAASGDKTLNEVYGPQAPTFMDIYTHAAVSLGGEVGAAMRAQGYDPKNPTKEAVAAVKKNAKKWRSTAKVLHLACISEGTLVRVQHHGWKAIETVLPGEQVWDGQEWVNQDGPILKGTKTCVNFGGTAMTPSHEVMTNDGWQISSRTDPSQCIRPRLPSAGWTDVWTMVRNVFRSNKKGWV